MQQADFDKLLAEQALRKTNFLTFQTSYFNERDANQSDEKFFEKKLAKLQTWWVGYDKANTELTSVTLDEKEKELEYFKNDDFEVAKKEYLALRGQMQGDMIEAKDNVQSSLGSTSTAAKVMKGRVSDIGMVNVLEDDSVIPQRQIGAERSVPAEVRVLRFQINELKTLLNTINGVNSESAMSAGMASAQLDMIKTLWNELRTTHRALMLTENGHFYEDERISELQSEFISACGKLTEITKKRSDGANANLPKLKLPDFDGKTSWLAFRELYDEIVHNNNQLSDKAKAQYLKTVLKGEAATVISFMGASEENYQAIYDALVRRYDNKRRSVSELIEKLMNIPKMTTESSSALRNLHDTVKECITAISNLEVSTKDWDPLVVHILLKKLNKDTILDYESKLVNVRELQKLSEFLKYIENRFLALLSTENSEKSGEKSYEKHYEKSHEKTGKKEVPFKCSYCDKPHSVYKCSEFFKLDAQNRYEWAKQKKVCFVCLQVHRQGECRSKYLCKTCSRKHNTLLHIEMKKDAQTTLIATHEVNETTAGVSNCATKDEKNLLATAIVRVKARNGDKIGLRAVIDQGSQGSMLTEHALQKLKLPVEKVSAGVDGFSGAESVSKKRVELEISPRFSDDFVLHTRALVFNKITSLAVFKGDLKEYNHLQNLLYADPSVQDDSPIDILLNVAD